MTASFEMEEDLHILDDFKALKRKERPEDIPEDVDDGH